MKEVSCKVVGVFLQKIKEKKVSPDVLLEGVPYSLTYLKNSEERMEWDVLRQFLSNARKVWSEEELVALGGSFMESPLVRFMAVIARLLFTARDFYHWLNTPDSGFGNQMFTCITPSCVDIEPGRLVIELRLSEGYAACREFFLLSKGGLAQMPRLVGLAKADITMEEISDGARYHVHYPQGGGILQFLWKAVTWPFTVRAAARELKRAHEVLLERYKDLEAARNTLEIRVQERTAELAHARDELALTVDELREAKIARDRIFSNINHEIRTPLTLILLAVGELRLQSKERVEQVKPRLEAIEMSAKKLLRLVDELLLLAAGQESKLQVKLQPTDLVALLKLLLVAWTPAIESEGLELRTSLPEECWLTLDEVQIERVVTNLLSNAVKFTPRGGSIFVELIDKNGHIDLKVRDTGIGIDDEFRKRMFDRFQQSRMAHAAKGGGSGIGLSLVKELVVAHGGTIEVEAPKGGGTIFCVSFPSSLRTTEREREGVQRPAWRRDLLGPSDFGHRLITPTETTTMSVEHTESPRATVLVAEDDADLARSIATLLAPLYRVLIAPNGIVALELAAQHQPDMLISDVAMPGMDGLELTRRFRELPGNRLAPILLLSALSNLSERLAGFEAGALDYMVKPFDPSELVAKVQSQLNIRSLALRLSQSEKLAALGTLSAGLAHEMRNPANALVNAIEPLKNLLPQELLDPEKPVGQLLEVLEESSNQIALLSRQLLGFKRPTELERHPEEFPRLWNRTLAIARPILVRRDVKIDVQYGGSLHCAGSLLIQVFTNLIENAAHAAGEKGWVAVTAKQQGESLVVEVQDSGPGVPREIRERIFEPFFTTKPPGQGTGLGLSTARTIVERHGGVLDVREIEGRSTFHVELPLEVAS